MILSGTGHRPQSITTFGGGIFSRPADYARLSERLRALARAALERHQPQEVVSGMALGWDIELAAAALELGVPLTAAVPFRGQEGRWAAAQQERYHEVLGRCARVVVSPGGFSGRAMQARNEWMVEAVGEGVVLALWNGAPGGTGNCVRYARERGCRIVNVWPSFVRHCGLPFIR